MKVGIDNRPPKIPLRFLRWFCNKDMLEDIEGDLTELYFERIESNRWMAKSMFWWEVFLLCRPGIVKNLQNNKGQNNLIMLKNYYKTSLRSMIKHPLSSFINIFGLAAAIGICVFAYGFGQWTYRTDQFHENKESIFLVTHETDREGVLLQHGHSAAPLGKALVDDFPHVIQTARITDESLVVKYEHKVFHEYVRFVDPEFMDMFTFPLKQGAKGALQDIDHIILSEPMAIKYFGEGDPIGQLLKLSAGNEISKSFRVAGVARKFPESRSFSFHFLVHIDLSLIHI